MSEYQYYEFLALDQPLTREQRAELRSVSSRAEITATRFVNEYEYGDLQGDPREMVERYFDAFLYLANWGTRQVMFRLPRGVLHPELQALADRDGNPDAFSQRFLTLRARHARQPNLQERFDRAGLPGGRTKGG